MLKDEVQQVIEIARMVAREEIARALKASEAKADNPATVPEKKEVKKNA